MKRLAWFLFKSPQRTMVGWHTLWTDMEGLVTLFFRNFFSVKNKPLIWICVGNKNRSADLLGHLLSSMAVHPQKNYFALSVADGMSSDVPDLKKEIANVWKGPLVFSDTDMPFSRSAMFNKAIAQAPGELVFVCDADLSLPKNLASLVYKFTTKKTAWFPVCQWQLHNEQQDWKWFSAGTGIFSASKKQLQVTGLYDEKITAWGGEDWDLFFRFYQNQIMPFRTRCNGLYHHWHPSSKPVDFQNIF